ncbi:MAG: shikimate kinase [Verrucomicrobiae bacterium]|nr:shikimate kinase [Verrucomicrobiae bacterium]
MDNSQKKRQFQNIALIGFMGTGKTTIGRLVASLLNYGFLDTDHLIEMRVGKKISQIFQEEGEAKFREYERQAVDELSTFRRMVFATGGGLGANLDNLQKIKTHSLIVCLWASPETIYERVKTQTHRPLLCVPDPLASIKDLLSKREPVYRQADILISTDYFSPRDVAQKIVSHFRTARAKAKRTIRER